MNAKEIVKNIIAGLRVMSESGDWSVDRQTCAAAIDLIDKLQALAENGQSAIDTNMRLVKVVESLQAQLAASQRRAQDARNELCQKCGRYRESHNGACNGCRWRENEP